MKTMLALFFFIDKGFDGNYILLAELAFSFSPNEYIGIHRRLFQGIYKHAGKIRDYNITKKEWVLGGATVLYGSASELRETLEYDFRQERSFDYRGLSMDEIIHHLSVFISRLWQIHIFGEGNTRTTAVFFIKYLRSLGFSATNDIFAVYIPSLKTHCHGKIEPPPRDLRATFTMHRTIYIYPL